MAFSPDGAPDRAALGDWKPVINILGSCELKAWDAETGQELPTLQGGADE